MTPINNSDTAWLIVSDYNQDNNKFYQELIDDVNNPNINEWFWTPMIASYSRVGSHTDIMNNMNNSSQSYVGAYANDYGSVGCGYNCHVGGHFSQTESYVGKD